MRKAAWGGTLKMYDERGRFVREEMTRHKSLGRWCNAFFPPRVVTWSSGQLHPVPFAPKLHEANSACLEKLFCGQCKLKEEANGAGFLVRMCYQYGIPPMADFAPAPRITVVTFLS
jgi:hypothetical protein